MRDFDNQGKENCQGRRRHNRRASLISNYAIVHDHARSFSRATFMRAPPPPLPPVACREFERSNYFSAISCPSAAILTAVYL